MEEGQKQKAIKDPVSSTTRYRPLPSAYRPGFFRRTATAVSRCCGWRPRGLVIVPFPRRNRTQHPSFRPTP